LATWRVPSEPPAPPWFSITICWPSALLMGSATPRANTSLPPPGA
jgi:hypothetical protein